MGKTKDSKSAKASKVLASVKESRVTKPEIASKKSSKQDTAKKAKASKRAPTPDSESSSSASDSEADSGSASDEDVSDNSSDSSDSSDSEAEQKPTKAQPSKVNGAAKVANGAKPTVNDNDDDDDDSDSSEGSDSDDEAPARPSKAAPNAKSAATGAKDDDDSSDSSDSSDDSDDEGKPTLNGKAAKKADESSEGSSESDSDEEAAAQPEPVKKRKADFAEAPAAKKAKAFEGENGNAVANLFVGNLSWNIDEEWLRREFEEFGEVVGCRIITDRDSGRSKGFGYVEFAQVGDATTALEAKKGGLLDGRELNIDYSTPRPKTQQSNDRGQWANDRANKYGDVKSEPTATLWVGNISFNASSDDINNAFAEYGTITRVALPTDMETGAPKGYGYVDFTTVEEAQAAFEGLNGYEIAGRSIRIDYASPRTGGGDRGGRGRGGFGGFNDRGRGGRGGFHDRGRGGRGGRGGFNDRGRGGGRGNFSKNRGGLGDFSGTKMTF